MQTKLDLYACLLHALHCCWSADTDATSSDETTSSSDETTNTSSLSAMKSAFGEDALRRVLTKHSGELVKLFCDDICDGPKDLKVCGFRSKCNSIYCA